jgi:hypothetical protein
LLSAEHERRESTEGNNGDEFDNSCFVHIVQMLRVQRVG